jgi:hypothetical protein
MLDKKASYIKQKEDIVHIEDKPQSGQLRVGKTLYHLNVHFGKTPLEEILKDKFLNRAKTQ